MKKYFSALFIIMIIIPSVAMASWWNPFSWNIFSFLQKKESSPQVEIQKTSEEKINELQKQLDDLKLKQSVVTPATPVAPVTTREKDVEKNIPIVNNPIVIKAESPKVVTDVCAEIEGIQSIVPIGYVKFGSGPCILASSIDVVPQNVQNVATNIPLEIKPSLSVYQGDAYYNPSDSYWYIKFNISNKSDKDVSIYSVNYSLFGVGGLGDGDFQNMTVSVEGISSAEESIGVNHDSYSKDFSPNIIFPAHESKNIIFKYKPSFKYLEWNKSFIEVRINSIITTPNSSISLPVFNRATATK